jgi:hypothetical protein
VELDFGSSRHVRQRGIVVQKKNERGALPKRVRDIPSSNDAQRIFDKDLGKPRSVARRWTGHEATPFAEGWIMLENENRIIHPVRRAKQPYKIL